MMHTTANIDRSCLPNLDFLRRQPVGHVCHLCQGMCLRANVRQFTTCPEKNKVCLPLYQVMCQWVNSEACCTTYTLSNIFCSRWIPLIFWSMLCPCIVSVCYFNVYNFNSSKSIQCPVCTKDLANKKSVLRSVIRRKIINKARLYLHFMKKERN